MIVVYTILGCWASLMFAAVFMYVLVSIEHWITTHRRFRRRGFLPLDLVSRGMWHLMGGSWTEEHSAYRVTVWQASAFHRSWQWLFGPRLRITRTATITPISRLVPR